MFKKTFLYVFFVFVYLFTQYSLASDIKEAEIDLAEEGWRYQRGFDIKVVSEKGVEKNFNFHSLHSSMAFLMEASQQLLAIDFESMKGGKAFSIFRFTTIEMTASGLEKGATVSLPSALFDDSPTFPLLSSFIPSQETIFASGFCDVDGTKGTISKFITTKDFSPFCILSPTKVDQSSSVVASSTVHDPQTQLANLSGAWNIVSEKAEKMFVMLPPIHPEKPHLIGQAGKYDLSVRFIQRNYIDPSLFARHINFRYPKDNEDTIFSRGNYDQIRSTHEKAKSSLEQREKIIEEDFEKLKGYALKADIVEVLKGFENLKKGRHKFHDSVAANSYTCAEQGGVDYLFDKAVFEYLQKTLAIREDRIKGLIIHLHCSHTPCSSCATAIARECEQGGLFYEMARGKPIKVISSCSSHYDRPIGMVPYKNTKWLESLISADGILFCLDEKSELSKQNLPYPVTLLKFDPRLSSFNVNEEQYRLFLS